MCLLSFTPASYRKRRLSSSSTTEPCPVPRVTPLPTRHDSRRSTRIIVPTLNFPPQTAPRTQGYHPRPDTLRGHGVKRAPPPPPPPPSPTSARNVKFEWPYVSVPLPRAPKRDEEHTYRTVYASPSSMRRDADRDRSFAVRAATRSGLEESTRPRGGRLRRVAGYEVLSAQVPWGWDCMDDERPKKRRSSGAAGTASGLGRYERRYPPFGPLSSWM
ncbi:hypothetical protein K432DRAFT_383278 [Lepidopterella palustris CBS 459.81]|uniref:Uncharacterized protein n=1 Tax=Lepidopterella palustris CBS 459.81 TaxID=1314670 RepID=A0A8E2E8G8_9PEZI|nr:hypothetical protein K432DRAFT_383278 [Lepidopterella palustris CBS 459.81]